MYFFALLTIDKNLFLEVFELIIIFFDLLFIKLSIFLTDDCKDSVKSSDWISLYLFL